MPERTLAEIMDQFSDLDVTEKENKKKSTDLIQVSRELNALLKSLEAIENDNYSEPEDRIKRAKALLPEIKAIRAILFTHDPYTTPLPDSSIEVSKNTLSAALINAQYRSEAIINCMKPTYKASSFELHKKNHLNDS